MKTDLYTKIVLTAIAIFLGALVFQNINLTTPAYAAPAPIPMPAPAASQADGVIDVNIVQINGTEVGYSYPRASLPVSIRE